MEGCRTSVSWQKGLSGTWYCSAFLSKVRTSSSLGLSWVMPPTEGSPHVPAETRGRWVTMLFYEKSREPSCQHYVDHAQYCLQWHPKAWSPAGILHKAMWTNTCIRTEKKSHNSKDYFSKYGVKHKVTFLAISVFPLMRQTHTAIKQQSLLLGWIWATERKPLAHL